MSERTISLDFTGLDRYCPSCGRLLVHVNRDGTFDLAGKAFAHAEAEVDLHDPNGHALIVEAECLLWRCRVRRWLGR